MGPLKSDVRVLRFILLTVMTGWLVSSPADALVVSEEIMDLYNSQPAAPSMSHKNLVELGQD